MVIANGFITKTVGEAHHEVCNRVASPVLPVPFPSIDTMTYWLSEQGELFGCQRMKNMCVTKPLRVERRYKRGCHVRYAIGKGNQEQAFMQNVMYSTFILKSWDADMEFVFHDGNQYNFMLENIEPKQPKVNHVLLDNVFNLQSVYARHHLAVAYYIRKFFIGIPLEDCKDIASEAFFYLCGFKAYTPDYFIGIWKQTAENRAIDWWKKHIRCNEDIIWHEDGEERFGNLPNEIEVADIWRHIRGKKRTQTMQLYAEGLTPTEIAEEMHCTLGTVSSCISRTVKKLQSVFRKELAVGRYIPR